MVLLDLAATEPPPRSGRPSAALLMGLANLPFGLWGGLFLVTAPQLLAAQGVPEPRIASITAAALVPSFAGFLLAPIVDVRFSRRAYAWVFGLATAVLAVLALVSVGQVERFAPLLVAGTVAAALYNIAVGGWLGDVVAKGDEAKLAAGFQIGNAAGFGLGAIAFITLVRALPPLPGAIAVGAIIAAPLALLLRVPVSRRDRLGLHESFLTLGRDLLALARRPLVRRAMLLTALPTCGFALSNTLTGLGNQFGASERFVALVAGPAVTVVGIGGALLVAPLVRRFSPGYAYLATGVAGAAFTAALFALPRVPWVLALGISGENGLQSVAFAIASTIIFRSIGEDNPLAATQYALLNAAVAFPVTYMQWVDGQAYGAGGLDGALLTDAALALTSALLLWPVVAFWRRRGERAF